MSGAGLRRPPLYFALSLVVAACAVSIAWTALASASEAAAERIGFWLLAAVALLAQALVLLVAPALSRRPRAVLWPGIGLVGLGACGSLWAALGDQMGPEPGSIALFGAVILMLLGVQAVLLAAPHSRSVVGVPLIDGGVFRRAAALPLVEPEDLSRRSRVGGLILLLLAFALAVLAQGNFAAGHAALEGQYEDVLRHRDAALVLYAAMAIAVLGLCWWQRRWRLPGWPGPRRLYATVLVALVAAGMWLRFDRLDQLPPGLWIDEALNGVVATEIARTGRPMAALPPEDVRTGLGAGYVNVAALVFWLFDPDDGPLAIRAVAAGMGVLGLAGLAALAWAVFGPRTAVVATAWLAVSQYHMNYSRWGCMPIMSSVVEVLAGLGLLAGFRCRGWRSWLGMVTAGFLIGAGVYTYQSFRLFLVAGVLLGALLVFTRPRPVIERWPQLVVAGLVALVVAVPMVRYAVIRPDDFSERAMRTLVLLRPDWKDQLSRAVSASLLGFQFIGDENPRHNLPRRPLLTFIPAMLAPMGLVVSLYRWRSLPYALIPVWFLVALLPGAITLEAPHASRLLDTIVPVALMVGIAVDTSCATLQAALSRRGIGLAAGFTAVLLGAAATAQREYEAYFVERGRLPEFVDAFLPHEAAPGRYLEERVPTGTVFLDPATYGSPTTRFIARRYFDDLPNDVRVLRLMHDFPPRERLHRDAVYVLPYQYTALVPVIRTLVPSATCEEVRDRFERIDLTVCSVPYGDLNALRRRAEAGTLRWPHGLLGRFYHTPDGSGDPYYETVVPFVFLDYPIDAEPVGAFEFAAWEGYIRVPRAGDYYFRIHPDSTALTIAGQRIIEPRGEAIFGGGNEGRAVLAEGLAPIRITFRKHPRAPYFLWFFWEPPGGEGEWVPSSILYPPD